MPCATVVQSLAVLSPVTARALPSDTQPEAARPEGGATRTLPQVDVAAVTVEVTPPTLQLKTAAPLELKRAAALEIGRAHV